MRDLTLKFTSWDESKKVGASIGDRASIRDGVSISRPTDIKKVYAKSMIFGDFQCKYLTKP